VSALLATWMLRPFGRCSTGLHSKSGRTLEHDEARVARSDLDADAHPITVQLLPCEAGFPDNVDGEERGRDIIVPERHYREQVHRDRDARKPQRRGFYDDNYSPRANFGYASRESSPRFEPAPAGPLVSATVKWYGSEKGFGFVKLPSGGDALLHVSVVERGNSTVPPGATLEVRTAHGPEGFAIN
jgi:cold shock CspA family protein